MTANAGASLLEIERDRLQGALNHLERSVVELKQAIAESGPDQDYKDAINENVVVIAKYRARIAALEDEIKRAKGIKGDISAAQLAAVPVNDNDVDMAVDRLQQQQHMSMAPPAAAPQQATPAQQQQQHVAAAAAAGQQESSSLAMDVDAAGTDSQLAGQTAAGDAAAQQEPASGVWL